MPWMRPYGDIRCSREANVLVLAMQQTSFTFPDGLTDEARRLSRRADPLPSKAAAKEIVASGKLGDHERKILGVLKATCAAMTASQIDALCGIGYVAVARRM